MSEAAAKSSFLAAAVDLDAVLDDLERVEEEQQQQLAAAKVVLGNGENGNGEEDGHDDNFDIGQVTSTSVVPNGKKEPGEKLDEVDVSQVTAGLDVGQVTKGLDVAQVSAGLDVAQVTEGLCFAQITDGLESLSRKAPEEVASAVTADEANLQNGGDNEIGEIDVAEVENGAGDTTVPNADEHSPSADESTGPVETDGEICNVKEDEQIEAAAIDPASMSPSSPPTDTVEPPPASAENVRESPDHFVSIYDVKGDDTEVETGGSVVSAPQTREENSETVAAVGELCDPSDDGAVGGARPKSKQNSSGTRDEGEGGAAAEANPEGPSARRSSLGDVAPLWVPDSEAPACMRCEVKFTLVKRRHHCRSCGKVFCGACCGQKHVLRYLDDGKPSRVCDDCKAALEAQDAEAAAAASPARNPPPGVLKKNSVDQGSASAEGAAAAPAPATPSENKQVMFSDGVRPGGDLTELDGSSSSSPSRRPTSRKKSSKSRSRNIVIPHEEAGAGRSLLPESRDELPAVWGAPGRSPEEVAKALERGDTLSFIVNNNLLVRVKLLLCKSTKRKYKKMPS